MWRTETDAGLIKEETARFIYDESKELLVNTVDMSSAIRNLSYAIILITASLTGFITAETDFRDILSNDIFNLLSLLLAVASLFALLLIVYPDKLHLTGVEPKDYLKMSF